ncbi:hypothetical protein E5288_WYG003299 [Bos mutus]|uniref:Uncharacterized protein n=1 Tax=Bos mutus TaxID=72004 RepID=A0A6B0S454_9CETA|nr:hypothetical protein [Bos mutus]
MGAHEGLEQHSKPDTGLAAPVEKTNPLSRFHDLPFKCKCPGGPEHHPRHRLLCRGPRSQEPQGCSPCLWTADTRDICVLSTGIREHPGNARPKCYRQVENETPEMNDA